MASPDPPSPVETFLNDYKYRQVYWAGLAETAKELCESNSQRPAIQALFTCRGKSLESLKHELEKRNRKIEGGYANYQAICKDIVDLSGVRIALYIPTQRKTVEQIVHETFDVVKAIHLPNNEKPQEDVDILTRFPGYTADHFRVRLREADIQQIRNRPKKATDFTPNDETKDHIIEVQVVSVLQHAWAEVGHDILYKTIAGPASRDERRVLDGLNGLVQVGELLLEQVHDLYVSRVTTSNKPFAQKHELGSFLFNWISQNTKPEEVILGPIEVLRKFLQVRNLDTPKALESELERLDFDTDSNSDFRKTSAKYEGFTPRASIYIMDRLLPCATKVDNTLKSAKEARRENRNKGDAENQWCMDKYKIMVSAMIWLDELFSPFSKWHAKFSSSPMDVDHKEGLKWIMDTVSGPFFLGEAPITDEERKNLEKLWNWFEKHPAPTVKLVLKISKLGVLRDIVNEGGTQMKILNMLSPYFDHHG